MSFIVGMLSNSNELCIARKQDIQFDRNEIKQNGFKKAPRVKSKPDIIAVLPRGLLEVNSSRIHLLVKLLSSNGQSFGPFKIKFIFHISKKVKAAPQIQFFHKLQLEHK